MPRGKPFRNDLDPGRVTNCAQRLVQPSAAADALQRPLGSRFRARLSFRVSWLYELRMMTCREATKEVSYAVLAESQYSR